MDMKTRSRWGWLLILGVLVGVFVALSLAKHSARSIRARGWEIRLIGASYGLEQFAPPQHWNRIKSGLPRRLLQSARATRPVPAQARQPRLVVWLETRLVGGGRHPGGELRFEWTDGVGLRGVPFRTLSELEVLQASGRSGSEERSSWHRQGLVTRAFPRRMSKLPFTVFSLDDAGEVMRLGELSVPNPVQQSFPSWEKESLPASREVEGMQVELECFTVAPDADVEGYRWAEAVCRISRRGEGVTAWSVEALELEDPTGNRAAYGKRRPGGTVLPLRSRPSAEGRLVLEFPWLGWEAEPVWQMTFQLCPVGVQALAVGDPGVVLRSIGVPLVDRITVVDQVASLGDVEIKVLGLAGAHASLPGRAHDVFGQSTVELEVPRLPRGHHLAVLAVGEGGEVLPPGRALGEGGESVGLQVPDEVEVLNLGLVLYPERQVSFRVGE